MLEELDNFVIDPTIKAENELVRGRAYAGLEDVPEAIDAYTGVTTSYPRSKFSAEAFFRMGVIYQEKLDSLEVAQQKFDNVPRQYASSEFAEDAVARSVSISKLLRLQASIEAGEGENNAAVQFDLAEIELFQFKNYTKALAGYRRVLDEFPESDLAPKAAYAIAFIYDTHLDDPTRAREAYQAVVDRYPESQQAEFARSALGDMPGRDDQ